MRLHICWPWVAECGHTWRIYAAAFGRSVDIALTPNSTFSQVMPNGSIKTYWIRFRKQ